MEYFVIAYCAIFILVIYAIYRYIKHWYDNVQENKEEQNQLLRDIDKKLDQIIEKNKSNVN